MALLKKLRFRHRCCVSRERERKDPWLGFEPRSPTSKSSMLTTTPPRHWEGPRQLFRDISVLSYTSRHHIKCTGTTAQVDQLHRQTNCTGINCTSTKCTGVKYTGGPTALVAQLHRCQPHRYQVHRWTNCTGVNCTGGNCTNCTSSG